MKKLLSLPAHLVNHFHDIYGADRNEWFCASDPEERKVGSGGGTVSLIDKYRQHFGNDANGERMIIIHACGESRRLPAYAAVGKVLTPVPVFRWASGQSIDQTLLSLQMPLYESIMEKAPKSLRTLIASGDVYIRAENGVGDIPEADVVCFGIWVDATLASHHGVFVLDRNNPDRLHSMLQKPSVSRLSEISASHYFLMDIGIWMLSDKAIRLLEKRSKRNGEICYYDLYSDFGCALGHTPGIEDAEINSLKTAIIPLQGGEFYHFGTSAELVSSTLALQSKVSDQRFILHKKIKPSSALFTQNCRMDYTLDSTNDNIWIENSHVAEGWSLTRNNIVTGVPENDWSISLPENVCLDMAAIGDTAYALRPYGYFDMMRGALDSPTTMFMGQPIVKWLADRAITPEQPTVDIQNAELFPVVSDRDEMQRLIKWMTGNPADSTARELWIKAPKLSANGITANANLNRIAASRRKFLEENIRQMSANYDRSILYQLDLNDLAGKMRDMAMDAPDVLPDNAPLMTRARNRMLRYMTNADHDDEAKAFGILRESVLSNIDNSKLKPKLQAYSDQIIWARSPVRIDLAGGWTDTPPFSLTNGANVVNMAVELNGQPPLQAFIKPTAEPHILLRSIDMSASETITEYSQLTAFHKVGSPFSIPKAALALAGFAPGFSPKSYSSLRRQLEEFGGGIELTLLSAVPAGSGLGTSSILAATVLAAISDFAGLAWDKNEICNRTLALEQLLTTGGGWQDQFGGVLNGVKLLQTSAGLNQSPSTRWLPESIFSAPETANCHLLYYTGITRVAKNILAEIVRGMFLNKGSELRLLEQMKNHALDMADAIQRGEFRRFGSLIDLTWKQNRLLDSGTNPEAVKRIIDRISDLCLGLKLPGAGGGGFIYMVAKDSDAAGRIRRELNGNPPNPRARFVEMSISDSGLQVSRS